MKFIIYRDRKKQFRWKLLSKNNKKKSIVRLCDGATSKVVDLTVKR